MSTTKQFPMCDAALKASDATTRPFLLIVEVFGHIMPSILLRQGDKAQALTLRLLEETQDIMDENIHGGLRSNYHM